jgi:hypothetical protein
MNTELHVDVTTLDAAHRRALEDVIGKELQANQRLVISVTEVADTKAAQTLDDWTKVYDGLSNEKIEAIDRDVKTRANLTRDLP